MTDYIDFKNRHLCDPDKEYCVLNLDLDGTPHSGSIVVYHRDQSNNREFELTDKGEAIQQELAGQGWEMVHQNLVRGGIYQVIHYERPKQVTTSPSKQSTYIRPTDKEKMQNGMEYACLTFSRNFASDGTFTIEFYDKQSYRKTEVMSGLWRSSVIEQFKGQGWQEKHGMGDGEWVMTYFERPISPANIANWLPTSKTPIPQPKYEQTTYAPRPKRTSPVPSTGDLEDGVEYMKIIFFRYDKRAEISIFGKGIQPSSQTRTGELHPYMEELKKEGWYHVYGTGDSEGILAYLERKRIES